MQAIFLTAADHFDERSLLLPVPLSDGAMTSLCTDVVDVEGHVVAVASAPRDATPGEVETDEDGLFDKSASYLRNTVT